MKPSKILIAISVAIVAVATWRGCVSRPGDSADGGGPVPTRRVPRGGGGPAEDRARESEREYAKGVAEKSREFSKAMNGPVEFYGRVVDQDEKPLEGVGVTYKVTSVPENPVPWGRDTITDGVTITDGTGRFGIKGYKGCSLSFSFKISGFRDWGGGASFLPNHPDCHHPDHDNPVEFTLIRDDLPTAKNVYDKRLRFIWNTGPVTVDLGAGLGRLQLTPKRQGANPANRQQQFDWSVEISSTGFSMVRLSEEFPRVAPSAKYPTDCRYDYPRDAKDWSSSVRDKYAIRTADGRFGLMELTIYGDSDDNGMGGRIAVYINESGARNIDHK